MSIEEIEEMTRDLAEMEEQRQREIRQQAAKECLALISQGSSFSSKKDFIEKIKSHFELS